MSVSDETVSFSLEINVEQAYENVRKLQTILFRTLTLVKRLTGNEQLDAAISKMQRAISIANQMRLAFLAAQAASGPYGIALAGIGMAASMMASADFLEDEMRGR